MLIPPCRQTPNPVHHKLDRNLTKDEFGGLVHHLREREAKMRRRDRVRTRERKRERERERERV